MARPMKSLPTAGALPAFARALRTLQTETGLPLKTLAQRSGVSLTSLSNALGGAKRPSWRTVSRFVDACGGNPADWRTRWDSLQFTLHADRADSEYASLLKKWLQTGRINPPTQLRTEADLARLLEQMCRFRGLSLRALQRLVPGYSFHTYGRVLRGERPITCDVLIAVLTACEVRPTQRWLETLARVRPSEGFQVAAQVEKLRHAHTRLRPAPVSFTAPSVRIRQSPPPKSDTAERVRPPRGADRLLRQQVRPGGHQRVESNGGHL